MKTCPLCRNQIESQRTFFYQCLSCRSVFRDPDTYLSAENEKARYLLHNNDINDKGYQEFVAPVLTAVLKSFPVKSKGLDYGAGTGPVIAKLLSEKNYKVALYDPFFYPNTEVLKDAYDFIVCCEVIEHFHNPDKEFTELYRLLKPNGKLFCMTDLLPEKELFDDWYYKNDPTHVIFYSEENLKWIKENIGFSHLDIDGRLIEFTK